MLRHNAEPTLTVAIRQDKPSGPFHIKTEAHKLLEAVLIQERLDPELSP